MQSSFPDSLTRFVIDGDRELELARVQGIMNRILAALPPSVPDAQRDYLGTALLSLAVTLLCRKL